MSGGLIAVIPSESRGIPLRDLKAIAPGFLDSAVLRPE